MDWFELNTHLRLLRQSIQNTSITEQQQTPTKPNVQFIHSGQRLETLKSLRKLLKKFPNRLNNRIIISVFTVLKSIITELTSLYFNTGINSNNLNKNGFNNINKHHQMLRWNSMAQISATNTNNKSVLRKTLSTDNVFITAVRRNEILESLYILIDLISMNQFDSDNKQSNNQQNEDDSQEEDYFGRMFLPEIITLLGHESTDVQRMAIRFLQLNIQRTHNLQRTMITFIDYGLKSSIAATQFGSLNALPHLFIRDELRAENLGPLINSLALMLVNTQTDKPHLFYPTYIALERLNSLIGSKRFYQYLFNTSIKSDDGTDISKKAVTIYETVQKRAPSPQVYIANYGLYTFVDPATSSSIPLINNNEKMRRGSKNSITNGSSNKIDNKQQQQNKQQNGKNKTGQGLDNNDNHSASSMANKNKHRSSKSSIDQTIMEEEPIMDDDVDTMMMMMMINEDGSSSKRMSIVDRLNNDEQIITNNNHNEWSDDDDGDNNTDYVNNEKEAIINELYDDDDDDDDVDNLISSSYGNHNHNQNHNNQNNDYEQQQQQQQQQHENRNFDEINNSPVANDDDDDDDDDEEENLNFNTNDNNCYNEENKWVEKEAENSSCNNQNNNQNENKREYCQQNHQDNNHDMTAVDDSHYNYCNNQRQQHDHHDNNEQDNLDSLNNNQMMMMMDLHYGHDNYNKDINRQQQQRRRSSTRSIMDETRIVAIDERDVVGGDGGGGGGGGQTDFIMNNEVPNRTKKENDNKSMQPRKPDDQNNEQFMQQKKTEQQKQNTNENRTEPEQEQEEQEEYYENRQQAKQLYDNNNESLVYLNEISDDDRRRCRHGLLQSSSDFENNDNNNNNKINNSTCNNYEIMKKSSSSDFGDTNNGNDDGQGHRLYIEHDLNTHTNYNNCNNDNCETNQQQQHPIKKNSQKHSNLNRTTKRSSISSVGVGGHNANVKQQSSSSLNPIRQVKFANGYRDRNGGIHHSKQTSLKVLSNNKFSSGDDDDYYFNNKKNVNTNNKNNRRKYSSSNDLLDNEMAATASSSNFIPPPPQGSLASLTQLDADTLANIEYIPTMKDYMMPYYHPYYHDSFYHPATFAAAVAATSPILYPTAAAAASAALVANSHLLRFGIFPRVLIYQALSSIADEQFAAVQAIIRIVRDTPNEHLLLILPYMDEFLSIFVSQLLLDSSSNFKVILWTLDIIELLTERLKLRIHQHLSQLILLLSQRLGDNRIVIRDSVIKVFHQMMTRYCPQEMLDLLFKHVSSSSQHQQPLAFTSSSKLREEMANRVTASIATFPRNRLNIPKLCFDVAPFLIDRRSLVRLAALESVATLAQALGPHKLGSLMTAVHSLENSLTAIDFDRLIASIQARLARRSLPRVGPDGNVQYVLRVPTSSESWYYRRIYDADLEWIALGPTTPPMNVPPQLNTPTVLMAPKFTSKNNSEDLSSESSGEPLRTNDSSPLSTTLKPETSREERMAIQQQRSINSPDSEDIPPPVNTKVIVGGTQSSILRSSTSPEPDAQKSIKIRNRSRSKSQSQQQQQQQCSPRKTIIDPVGMAQDSPSPLRNFSDRQQQREIEQRCYSLERPPQPPQLHRSKTSQEFRPYGNKHRSRRDQFIDRLVRGESIDDSDLADAQWFRRSSTESLEAWRQYFGRFKKQMADISLYRPYGSRPSSSIYYGLSPIPAIPLTAATFAHPSGGGFLSPLSYYYHYYIANGLSNSYHDLSQLQQKNMMSIMKRSGIVSGSDQDQDQDQDLEKEIRDQNHQINRNYDDDNNQLKMDRKSSGRNETIKRSNKDSDIAVNETLINNDDNQHLEAEQLTLERSFSMPSIRTDSSTEMNDQHINIHPHHHQNQQEINAQIISDEIIEELGMWEQVIQEEKNQQQQSSNVIESTENVDDTKNIKQQQQRRPSTLSQQELKSAQIKPTTETTKPVNIPTVSIQPSTPAIQQQSSSGVEASAPPLPSPSTSSPPKSDAEQQQQQQQQQNVNQVQSESPKRKESIKKNVVDNKQTSIAKENDDNDSTKSTTAKSKSTTVTTVTKTGPPAPPASRRMSKPPQQLYIKTTPAIPMNANIQHILGNVARTEGPFDNPYDAVKAAVIALRDHAWTTKVEGMLAVVRLATFHPHHLIRDQHQISLALAGETRNLRSTVARSAIFTIGELFSKLRSQIEPELDILTQALLQKVSENSVFIREDIDRALQLMIESMPQTRAALSLITYGSSHRNTHVRRTSAQFLAPLVEKMGVMKCLLGPRDIGEHLLPAAARFLQDQSSHTRYFGRRIFAILMQHPLFDKFLRRHVSPGTYRNICGMLETIKRRGIGDIPSDLYSPTVQPKDSDPRRLIVVEATTPN